MRESGRPPGTFAGMMQWQNAEQMGWMEEVFVRSRLLTSLLRKVRDRRCRQPASQPASQNEPFSISTSQPLIHLRGYTPLPSLGAGEISAEMEQGLCVEECGDSP